MRQKEAAAAAGVAFEFKGAAPPPDESAAAASSSSSSSSSAAVATVSGSGSAAVVPGGHGDGVSASGGRARSSSLTLLPPTAPAAAAGAGHEASTHKDAAAAVAAAAAAAGPGCGGSATAVSPAATAALAAASAAAAAAGLPEPRDWIGVWSVKGLRPYMEDAFTWIPVLQPQPPLAQVAPQQARVQMHEKGGGADDGAIGLAADTAPLSMATGATSASASPPSATSPAPSTSFFAVFDGHAGAGAANFAATHLHAHLARHALFASSHSCSSSSSGSGTSGSGSGSARASGRDSNSDMAAALRDAFAAVEAELMSAADAGADTLRQQREAAEAAGTAASNRALFGRARPKEVNSGATALALLLRGRTLIVANLGDCRAVLGTRDGAARQLTADHTPLSEQGRIERAGGWLVSGQEMHVVDVASRRAALAAKQEQAVAAAAAAAAGHGHSHGHSHHHGLGHSHGSHGHLSAGTPSGGSASAGSGSASSSGSASASLPAVVCDPLIMWRAEHDPMRTTVTARVCGDLAVARALGDPDYKGAARMALVPWDWPDDSHPKAFSADLIVATPDVTTHELAPGDEFVLLACDGLWDVMTSDEAAAAAARLLRAGLSPTSASKRLIDMALLLGSSDNITAMIVLLPTGARWPAVAAPPPP